MKTIIVAVDFSNATPGVLKLAIGMAKAFGAELRLIAVMLEFPPVPEAFEWRGFGIGPARDFHESCWLAHDVVCVGCQRSVVRKREPLIALIFLICEEDDEMTCRYSLCPITYNL